MVVVANLGQAITKYSSAFVDLPKVSVVTGIVGRAQCTDFSQDLMPRMGVERIIIQALMLVPNEIGPNGERIWKPVNDIHDQIRIISGGASSSNDVNGPNVSLPQIGNCYEITFYGTGLNVLMSNVGVNGDYRATVDGGAEGSNFMTFSANYSTVIQSRNTASRQIVQAVSGLALGMHTVKIRRAADGGGFCNFYGFEVVTQSGTGTNVLQLTGGTLYSGSQLLNKSLTVDSYNSNFETGTLGTRGGRVVVYMKADGTIGKAVNPTNTSQLNLNAANHSNESITRIFNYREFSAGRTDDMSSLVISTGAAKAFVLDDGTTALSAKATYDTSASGYDMIVTDTPANSGQVTITFVGTGLDLLGDYGTIAVAVWTVTVDGVSIGTLDRGSEPNGVRRIVSGLPYGTHVVRFAELGAGSANLGTGFAVYGPAKPTVPSGATEIADYCILATYSANTTPGVTTISTGVIRKDLTREALYVNGTGGSAWALSAVDLVNNIGVTELFTSHQNSYVELVFYGTGIELRGRANTNRSANITVTIDGLAATTGNFAGLTSGVYGGWAFAAGVLNQGTADVPGAGLRLYNLPLGLHRVRFTQSAAGGGSNVLEVGTIDVVTPIHSYRNNGPGIVQNVGLVGNIGFGDSRNFPSTTKIPAPWAKAIGIFAAPSETATAAKPMPDMCVPIHTKGNPIEVSYTISAFSDTTSRAIFAEVWVDGQRIAQKAINCPVATYVETLSDNITIPVAAGYHWVQIYWFTNANTISGNGITRTLSVREQP